MKNLLRPFVVVLFLLLAFFSLLTLILSSQKITSKNTYVLDAPFSDIAFDRLSTSLEQKFPSPSTITLQVMEQKFPVLLSDLGLTYDYTSLSTQIISDTNRQRGLEVLSKLSPIFSPKKNYHLLVTLDQKKLSDTIDKINRQISQPFVPTQLELVGNQIKVKPGQLGQSLPASVNETIVAHFFTYDLSTPIVLTPDTLGSLPSPEAIQSLKDQSTSLIGKNLNLLVGDQTITLRDSDLISWLTFDHNTVSNSLTDYAQNLASTLTSDSTNAVFEVENGKVTQFEPSRAGKKVDPNDIVSSIQKSLDSLMSGKSVSEVKINYLSLDPKIKTSDANNLGITELLGRGTSKFEHSSEVRNHNVQTAARLVNRVLVAPGEEFSFTKNLGLVDASTGFKEAYVIKASGTELEYGGGVCQVSTTLFRAMLNAGVNITARKNHSYRVSYYEEDMPPGYDATVYSPNPDLRFKNDTPAYILVQNFYDGKNKTLTYEIWGKSDGRRAEITNYRRWDSSPPPPAKYIDDPTLPMGKLIKTETAVGGLKTAFDWKVTRDGQTLYEKTFTSTFVPWAAVFRRGTGTM